jgi:hypothetical protein
MPTPLEQEEHEMDQELTRINCEKLLADILAAYNQLNTFTKAYVPIKLLRAIERAKEARENREAPL